MGNTGLRCRFILGGHYLAFDFHVCKVSLQIPREESHSQQWHTRLLGQTFCLKVEKLNRNITKMVSDWLVSDAKALNIVSPSLPCSLSPPLLWDSHLLCWSRAQCYRLPFGEAGVVRNWSPIANAKELKSSGPATC